MLVAARGRAAVPSAVNAAPRVEAADLPVVARAAAGTNHEGSKCYDANHAAMLRWRVRDSQALLPASVPLEPCRESKGALDAAGKSGTSLQILCLANNQSMLEDVDRRDVDDGRSPLRIS